LRQRGVLSPGRVALMDLGWHGTVHKAAHRLAAAISDGTELIPNPVDS
jgi:hypothetical protein